MIGIFRITLLLTLLTLTLAVRQPDLTTEARQHYEDSHGYISNTYPPHAGGAALMSRREYYSHLLSGHTSGEDDLKRFTQTHPNGPIHVSYGPRSRYAYVTTKVPSNSDLGRRWGMGVPTLREDGERMYRELYAFWKMSKDGGVKLLRLDAWPVGGNTPQVMSWGAVRQGLRG